MGRIINPSEIREQANIIIKSLTEQNNHFLDAMKFMSDFIEEHELTGNAWEGQKQRMTVHINIIKCIVSANHSIIQDSKLLSINCGDEELYEDELLEIIESCQNQINNCVSQIESNNDKLRNTIYGEFYKEYTYNTINRFESIIHNYELIIFEAKQKIERINEIEENLNSLFNEYKTITQIIKEIYLIMTTCVNNINSLLTSVYNTGYDLVIGFIWSVIENQRQQEENFKKNIIEQFGFNEETAIIMWDVYEALKIKYPNASQKELDWRFTRLMGGFVYDSTDGEVLSFLDELGISEWKDVAGDPIDAMKMQELPTINSYTYVQMSEEEYFVEYLGISEGDYDKLRYYVRLQHQILEEPENYKLPEKIEECDSDKIEDFIKWKQIYEEKTGVVFENDQEFLDIWNQNYDAFYNNGDFAHQMITTTTYLANDSDKDGIISNIFLNGDNAYVEYMAGWLGDATLEPYSLGPDDYKADLDAVNIISYMDNYDMDYISAYNKYYSDIESGESRADIFLDTIPLDKVKYEIYHDLLFYCDETFTYEQDMLYKMLLKESRPDVYDFIISLENGANEMETSYEE